MPSSRLEPAARQTLLRTAAVAIEAGFGGSASTGPDRATPRREFDEPRASFVTITIEGALRGCCGTLEPARALVLDVWHNAQASAFRDRRFLPLTVAEWWQSQLEVSVLTPCEPMAVRSEQELLLRLVPGRDGLVLEWRGARATFLPKVWDQLADPDDFVRHLKLKAGWSTDFWATDLRAWRYETETMATNRPASLAQS